jgi:hypothetical protein
MLSALSTRYLFLQQLSRNAFTPLTGNFRQIYFYITKQVRPATMAAVAKRNGSHRLFVNCLERWLGMRIVCS